MLTALWQRVVVVWVSLGHKFCVSLDDAQDVCSATEAYFFCHSCSSSFHTKEATALLGNAWSIPKPCAVLPTPMSTGEVFRVGLVSFS